LPLATAATANKPLPGIRSTFCIEANTEWEICGEAENGSIALDMVREVNPDIVVLDLVMPGMNGLEAAREIVASAPHTRMIMFTANDCPTHRSAANSRQAEKRIRAS
jgi:DNA-binding NarL/FixJ family response regulator